jgi:hypothetical protein
VLIRAGDSKGTGFSRILMYTAPSGSTGSTLNSTLLSFEIDGSGIPYFPRIAPVAKSMMTIDATTGKVDVMAISPLTIPTISTTQNIAAATGITSAQVAAYGAMQVQSADADTMTVFGARIATGTNGQIIVFTGMDETKAVYFKDGTGLKLAGSVDFRLGLDDTITLMYKTSASAWIEVYGRNDN